MQDQKIIGIDISEERANIAKKRGYNKIHICNAYDLPFDDKSQSCVISNDVLVHVIQDEDIVKILKEVYRVLDNDGVFIFNFANSKGLTKKDNKMYYCKFRDTEFFQRIINQANFKIEFITSSYFTIPRIGAYPRFATFSTKIIFPTLDRIFKFFNITTIAKVIYFAVRK